MKPVIFNCISVWEDNESPSDQSGTRTQKEDISTHLTWMTQISFGSTIIFPNSVVTKISPFCGTKIDIGTTNIRINTTPIQQWRRANTTQLHCGNVPIRKSPSEFWKHLEIKTGERREMLVLYCISVYHGTKHQGWCIITAFDGFSIMGLLMDFFKIPIQFKLRSFILTRLLRFWVFIVY